MERTSESTSGSEVRDYRIKLRHMNKHIEKEVSRIKSIKQQHDEIREHRKELNDLLRHNPVELPRQVYKNLLTIERTGWGNPPAVVDMSDYAPDERLLLFQRDGYHNWNETAQHQYGWRFSLKDAFVIPTNTQLGRAVLWQMCLRAESRAKNNLMVTMREVQGQVSGNVEFYRDDHRHLKLVQSPVHVFGEIDCKPYDSWVVHVHRLSQRINGVDIHESGVVIVRQPDVVNLEKCETDYAVAMLAGVRSCDLYRRIGDED